MIPKKEQAQLGELNDSLQQLFRQLESFSDEQLNRRPDPSTWSPLMVMKHLMLAEGYSVKYIQKKLSFTNDLPQAGWRSRFRSWALEFYFGSPFKWKAPKGVDDSALQEKYDFQTLKKEWLEQRAELKKLLEGFSPERYGEEVYKHPFVGRLSPSGMLRFFQGHFDRHRKQIMARV